MILKVFSTKNLAKILAFFTPNADILAEKVPNNNAENV
jgi:hypothetical protein